MPPVPGVPPLWTAPPDGPSGAGVEDPTDTDTPVAGVRHVAWPGEVPPDEPSPGAPAPGGAPAVAVWPASGQPVADQPFVVPLLDQRPVGPFDQPSVGPLADQPLAGQPLAYQPFVDQSFVDQSVPYGPPAYQPPDQWSPAAETGAPDSQPVGWDAVPAAVSAGTGVPELGTPEPVPAGPPVLDQYPAGPFDTRSADPEPPSRPQAPEPPYPGTAQDPWSAPAQRRRKGLWLVVAGAAALAVVAVGVLLLWGRFFGGSKDDTAKASADRVAAVESTVRGYLEAVASGDAATALGYLAEKPASTELLTDGVLAASNQTAALTGIDVTIVTPAAATGTPTAPTSASTTALGTASADDTAEVTARYRLGDTDVDQTFTVVERGGSWKVVGGTATVDLSVSTGSLPLAVNGQAVSEASAAVLFPGSYTIAVTGDVATYLTLGTATFQVTDLTSTKAPTVSVALTDDGATAFRQAVRTAVDACVASPNLDSGCPGSGLDVPATMGDGTVTTEGSVVRTLSPDLSAQIDALEPRLYPSNPSRAYATAPDGLVNIAISGTRGGQAVAGNVVNSSTNQPGFQLGTPEVDMTDPALPVTWSGR